MINMNTVIGTNQKYTQTLILGLGKKSKLRKYNFVN